MNSPRFLLYSRIGCELCEEMLAELAALDHLVDVVDVDEDAAARIRYGHKVPVLLLGNELVCHGRLDLEEVDKALAYQARPV